MNRMNIIIMTIASTLALTGGAAVQAQSRQIPAPPQEAPIVIRSATIHPVVGDVIDEGYIVFDGGVITQMGAGAPPRVRDAEVVDADGMHVYPGLISTNTRLGLTEVGDIGQTNDYNEYGRVKPEVWAAVAINPDTDLIPVTRANGILTGLVFPSGGLISGRCAAIRFDGWTWEDMAIDADAGLVMNWPRTEIVTAWWMDQSEDEQRKEAAENLTEMGRVFDEAEAYVKAKDADPTLRTDVRFEAMRPYVAGEKRIFVNANSVGQIESAITWAARRGYRIVIVGGRDADQAAPLLARHEIPVILGSTHRLPSRRHSDYDEPFRLPAKLHEAGVLFSISTGGGAAHERNLNHQAATAAAYGLPKDAALRAVTIDAARIMGLDARLGSLERGKAATLIVTTGDPLEITTDTKMAFIEGRRIDLSNRHKEMSEKYQEKYSQ